GGRPAAAFMASTMDAGVATPLGNLGRTEPWARTLGPCFWRRASQLSFPKRPCLVRFCDETSRGQPARPIVEGAAQSTARNLVDAFELLGMDAAGHEQAIDAEAERAGQISPHGIADRQYPVERRWPAAAFGGERHGALIDRPVRFAVEDHLAA